MAVIYQQILKSLGPYRSSAYTLFFLLLIGTMAEAVSIGIMVPLLQVAADANSELSLIGPFLRDFNSDQRLLIIGISTVSIFLIRTLVLLTRSYKSAQFTNVLREYWSVTIYRNFLYSDYKDIAREKQGHFINNLVNEPVYASKCLHDAIDVIAEVFVFLSILTIMLFVNAPVTLFVFVVVLTSVGAMWRFSSRYATTVGRMRITTNQEVTQQVTETVVGVRQLKVFSAEPIVIKNLKDRIHPLMNSLNRFSVVNALPKLTGETVVVTIVVGTILLGRFVWQLDFTKMLPQIGLFTVGFMRLFSSVTLVLMKRMAVANYWPAFQAVGRLIEAVPHDNEDKGLKTFPFSGEVLAHKVSYSFNESKTVLNQISFKLKPGEIVGLAGKSGSGKTTLCDLITKLLTIQSGQITVGSHNLSDLNTRAWREKIGYVSQSPFIFNDTVKNNILMGSSKTDLNSAIEAARLADALDFIETLPQGFDTVIGIGGTGLSGGQYQRLAIARALARDSKLLIFDEATSALDFESESRIFGNVRSSVGTHKTVLVITHRLKTLKFVDRILFLSNGQVSEEGTFRQLVDASGEFSSLVRFDLENDVRA